VNFGTFQQIMRSSTADAAMSSASTAGSALPGIARAATTQPPVSVSPAPSRRYRTITFTPVDTASEMYLST
jgi:hypothetical protein